VSNVEELMVLGGLKTRFINASQQVADQIFAALAGADWRSPPRYACAQITSQLGIGSASIGELGGIPVVFLSTYSGVKFVGPNVEEKWNCSPRRIRFQQELMKKSGLLQSLELTDGLYALLHNIIVRYVTEFSAYPYQTCRTQNLGSGDTFLDIGAFRGYVSLKASLKVGASGYVYAIEPINENFEFVQEHAALNKLENMVCLKCAVSNETAPDVQFYATENQANACVQDHLGGSHRQTTVENLSTQLLVDKVMSRSPRRVIGSVTTNGTEMGIVQALAKHFVSSKIDYLELTIPIIYTQAEVPSFVSSMGDLVSNSKLDYPWLTLTYRR
jgi:FkbM family methyltransferase